MIVTGGGGQGSGEDELRRVKLEEGDGEARGHWEADEDDDADSGPWPSSEDRDFPEAANDGEAEGQGNLNEAQEARGGPEKARDGQASEAAHRAAQELAALAAVKAFSASAGAETPTPKAFSFETGIPFDGGHPRILAIYCSDGRYAEHVEALANMKGHTLHDTITLPGGPGLFDSWTGSFAMTDAVRRASAFLVRNHGIEEVLLVAHGDCGYYKERFTAWSEERIREQQVKDMRTAKNLLLLSFPQLRVEGWYACSKGEKVAFEKIGL